MDYFKRKIERIKSKYSLQEYGWKINDFSIDVLGQVEYAQWLHPREKEKVITVEMLNFYKQFIKTGDLVIDIGAHTGDTAVPIALCAGKQGTVLALEPNKYVFKVLEQNSKLNKNLTNIKPLNFAATETDGMFVFNYSDASYCNGGFFSQIKNQKHGHKHTLEVTGKNLVNYLHANYSEYLSKLTLIKVDAEGYDKEIIKSIFSIISKYKPNIISECNKNLVPDERFELFNILAELNYKLKMIENFEAVNLIPINKKEEMLQWNHFDFVATHMDSVNQ